MAVRTSVSALGTTTVTTLVVTWTGTQPNAGDKIVIGFWVSQPSAADPTTVKDNGVSAGTFTQSVKSAGSNAQQCWVYHLDGVVLPASGNYAVTVTWAVAPTDADGGGMSYSGVSSGAPAATSNNIGANSGPASPGAVNPTGTATYIGVVVQDTGANPGTVNVASPFTNQASQTNGATQQVGAVADDLNDSGSQNPTWTLDAGASHWAAACAVWTNTAAGTIAATRLRTAIRRGPPLRSGSRLLRPAVVTPTVVQTVPKREQKVGPVLRSRSRLVSPGIVTPTAPATFQRGEKVGPVLRSRPRLLAPGILTPTVAATFFRGLRVGPVLRARSRLLAPGALTATVPGIFLRGLRIGPSLRSRSRLLLVAPALAVPPGVTATQIFGLKRPGPLRSRSRLILPGAVYAPTAAGMIQAIRFKPALRSRSRIVLGGVAMTITTVPATWPLKGPKIPGPLRSRSRLILPLPPLPLGVPATLLRRVRLSPVARSRSRLLLGIPPPPPGVPPTVERQVRE